MTGLSYANAIDFSTLFHPDEGKEEASALSNDSQQTNLCILVKIQRTIDSKVMPHRVMVEIRHVHRS